MIPFLYLLSTLMLLVSKEGEWVDIDIKFDTSAPNKANGLHACAWDSNFLDKYDISPYHHHYYTVSTPSVATFGYIPCVLLHVCHTILLLPCFSSRTWHKRPMLDWLCYLQWWSMSHGHHVLHKWAVKWCHIHKLAISRQFLTCDGCVND